MRKRIEVNDMYTLYEKAQMLCKRLEMFAQHPSDYETVIRQLPNLIVLIEEMEAMSVLCRKNIAGYQKELPYYTGLTDKTCELNNVANEQNLLHKLKKNIKIEVENDTVKLTIFPLIKNISSRTKEYISMLISSEIKQYFISNISNQKPDFTHKNCVLVINSLYAKPELVRDNDSIETAAIINAIKTHFLTDDDGLHLSIYRMGSISERYETEIYLMEETQFLHWLTDKKHY